MLENVLFQHINIVRKQNAGVTAFEVLKQFLVRRYFSPSHLLLIIELLLVCAHQPYVQMLCEEIAQRLAIIENYFNCSQQKITAYK